MGSDDSTQRQPQATAPEGAAPEVAAPEVAAQLLTTGDMARLTGNTLRTVRFYEESGILTPDRRSAGGHRLFGTQQLERLKFVGDMRATGLSLEAIRALLALKGQAASGGDAAERTSRAVRDQLAALDEKIALLQRVREELKGVDRLLRTHCRQCTDANYFPKQCNHCDVIRSQPQLSQAMRVLWDVPADPAATG